jgi:hypothetical protein
MDSMGSLSSAQWMVSGQVDAGGSGREVVRPCLRRRERAAGRDDLTSQAASTLTKTVCSLVLLPS